MNRCFHWLTRLLCALAAITALLAKPQIAHSQQADFRLVIRPDASVWLRNDSGQMQALWAYYILSTPSTSDIEKWDPLGDQFNEDPIGFRSVFGQYLVDGSIHSSAGVQPDGTSVFLESILTGPPLAWPAGLEWPIGTPLGTDVSAIRDAVARGEITWFADYCEGCAHDFPIIFEIPEPATIVLLLCGLPGAFRLVRLRRRGTFQVE